MHKPELLIFDEPTMGLDPIIQQEFYHKEKAGKNQSSGHLKPC